MLQCNGSCWHTIISRLRNKNKQINIIAVNIIINNQLLSSSKTQIARASIFISESTLVNANLLNHFLDHLWWKMFCVFQIVNNMVRHSTRHCSDANTIKLHNSHFYALTKL